jgi:hypothetical protein
MLLMPNLFEAPNSAVTSHGEDKSKVTGEAFADDIALALEHCVGCTADGELHW